jgi:hypothetical protein
MKTQERICARQRGQGRGGEEWGVDFFLYILFIFDVHDPCCKMGRGRRGGRRIMQFGVMRWEFYSWIIILFLCCQIFFIVSFSSPYLMKVD